jgi:hypothetical protein
MFWVFCKILSLFSTFLRVISRELRHFTYPEQTRRGTDPVLCACLVSFTMQKKRGCDSFAAITECSLGIELLPKRTVARKNFVFFRVSFISSVIEVTQFKAHERRKLDITASLKLRRKDTTIHS